MLLVHPRIWAEESFYLAYALKHSILKGLLWSRPSLGYYLLTANLPAVIAALVSKTIGLEYAPLVTTYFSFAVQILPFAILIYGRSHLFRTRFLVSTGCLLMLVPATNYGEIWFTILHTKNWTGLAALIILFEDMSGWSNRKTWLFRWIVLFSGLSGPYAPVLAPVFVLSYFLYRERERLVQAGILAACCLIDLGLFIYEIHLGTEGIRSQAFTWDSAVVNVFYFQVVSAFLGDKSMHFCRFFGLTDAVLKSFAVPRGGQVITAAWFCMLAVAISVRTFWAKKRAAEQILLIATFLLFAAFTARTALLGIPSTRYASLPALAFLLLVLSAWDGHPRPAVRAVAAFLLGCSLAWGSIEYRNYFLETSAAEPAWHDEVQKWRKNASYAPAIWPHGWPPLDWKPDLSKRK